jgi:23S rRNA (adenine2503-C2)-methyltransferase
MPDIRDLSLAEIQAFIKEMGLPAFRAKQIYAWLWQKSAHTFEEMSDLPISLRMALTEKFDFNSIHTHQSRYSADGTIKSVFRLHDGYIIEGVMIPTDTRATACVSSQVGCSLSCKFCATGYMGRKRNLTAYEIYDQIVLINRQSQVAIGRDLSNIVFMGMGEPLLNYKSVLAAIQHITSPDGLGWSAKRITVSTAGIAKMIYKLADDGVKFNLALSLHAADDQKRNTIMPINEHNNLKVLVESLNYFYSKTKNKITFEYILLKGVNDTIQDANNLIKLTRKVPAKVNIIEYNPIAEAEFKKSTASDTEAFLHLLEKNNIIAKVRRSRGKDIDAACGQLANKIEKP